MPRAALNDDPMYPSWRDSPTQPDSVKVALDEDPCAGGGSGGTVVGDTPGAPSPFPTLTVRLRTRVGYDGDGTPLFDWTTIASGASIMWQERKEFDAEAGLTVVKAKTTMLYDGEVEIPETVSVSSGDDTWRVTAVRQHSSTVEFDLERIDQPKSEVV